MNYSKTPKGAVVERIGSESKITHLVCGLVEGNFSNILARAEIVRQIIEVELAFSVRSLQLIVVRHTIRAWWLASGYKLC
ncbi:hypothetical protein COO91_08495 [Nostoc flagelliforme CCNUN1]|uniref:Uncharacterized protein n=1 Tax=Nostoc flagelliforme CCNUN1 TaxID=2038116 RepID=A0A2K8T425_9NOSO|nr:hypothetical protein [Nostoc flagelliforme]AUB42370.1 hypothetical protein COO91_08495 [Nostoc flagelliforme CCNUN1]